ncbi:MAG: hypothetical protein V5A62_18735 [Haloarculaceae archaeon]
MSIAVRVGPVALPRDAVLQTGLLLTVELALLGAYLALTDWSVLAPRYLLYPLAWVTVGVLAVVRTAAVDATPRSRLLAAGIAGSYLLVLLWVDGSVSLQGTGTGFRLAWLPPGWGPAVLYGGDSLSLALFPYRLVGYASLAYLLYATVVTASRAALGGLVGLVSCVSCTLPVVAALLSSLVGGSAAVTAAATTWSYDLSTVVFLLAIGLFYWQPLAGGRLTALVSRW